MNNSSNKTVLNASTDAAVLSQALLASLVAAPHQQGLPPPTSNTDLNLLQALLAASQAANAQASSSNSDSAAALLLASQLQRPASNMQAPSPDQAPLVATYPASPPGNRPRKSKKFRYSAVLKQIRQAEVG